MTVSGFGLEVLFECRGIRPPWTHSSEEQRAAGFEIRTEARYRQIQDGQTIGWQDARERNHCQPNRSRRPARAGGTASMRSPFRAGIDISSWSCWIVE
jgi:hypothetical protein